MSGEGASERLVYMTRLREPDNQGTSGAARERVYSKNFKWDGKGGEISEGENRHGALVTTSLAPTAREGASASFDADLVFGLNIGPLSDFLSSAGPEAEVAIEDVTTIEAKQAVQHADDSQGPALVGNPGDFSAFAGLEDHLIRSSGWPEGAETNGLPRAIKAVHQDGSQIDLDPAYTTGPVGKFGAPLIDTAAGPEISVTVGQVLTIGNSASIPWVSYEGVNPDIGMYQLLVGGGCNKWDFKGDGSGKCTESFEYMFRDYLPPTPASAGSGVIELPEARNDHVTGKQVLYAALGGSTQVLQESLVNTKWTGKADLEIQGPTTGADSAFGVERKSEFKFEGEFESYHTFDTTMLLSQLGRAGLQVPFDYAIRDLDANEIFYHFPRVGIPQRAVPSGGKGTWSWKAGAGRFSNREVMITIQLFPAS